MSVNTGYDTAWEDINYVIQKVEEEALKARNRTDILFYNYGTIEQGKHVIQMGFSSTDSLKQSREGQNTSDWDGDMLELIGMMDGREFNEEEPWNNSSEDIAREYLQRCFGCSFRMAFDWQLNPLALLGPLLDAARQIAKAVKTIEDALDPFQNLQELCAFMDQLKIFCPQDLAMLLMSLKMLIMSYALKGFQFKLDWTVILGPILKAIAELLIAIVDAVLMLVLAPIDCALGALRAAESVERAGRSLAGGMVGLGNAAQQSFGGGGRGAGASSLERDVHWKGGGNKPFQKDAYGLGTVQGRTQKKNASKDKAYGTGFEVKAGIPFDQAIKEPEWANATVLQKAVVGVATARQHLVNLFDNLKITLDSLGQLVSGGLALSLELGGVLLALFDLIGMIMMIIRMFNQVGNPNEVNWCDYLAENPEMLREQLRQRYRTNQVDLVAKVLSVFTNADGIASEEVVGYSVIVNGQPIGDIPLCVSSRDTKTAAFLDQWIQDLESGS